MTWQLRDRRYARLYGRDLARHKRPFVPFGFAALAVALAALGFANVAVSSYYPSTVSADVGIHDASWASFANGLAIGFIWVPLTVISPETLPARHRTVASTSTSLARNHASSVGVSIAVAIPSPTRTVSQRDRTVA